MTKMLLVAACALIDIDGRVLLATRPEGKDYAGLWEFPGGKVESSETTEEALIRELYEELSIDVTANCLAPLCFSTFNYENVHLLMPLYICRRWKGNIQPLIGQKLKWVQAKNLKDYNMPPVDVPLIPSLIDILP